MLSRFMFVAGMTIGVMAPLIWAAYVSVPTFRYALAREGTWAAAKPALPEAQTLKASQGAPYSEKANSAPVEDTTASVSSTPALEKMFRAKYPEGAPDYARPRKMVDPALRRDALDAINLYAGPHIIIVCSELTRIQKLRMGCP